MGNLESLGNIKTWKEAIVSGENPQRKHLQVLQPVLTTNIETQTGLICSLHSVQAFHNPPVAINTDMQ